MNKTVRILKGIFLILYLLSLVYLVLNNTYISALTHIPVWFVPGITGISIILFGIGYIRFYFKIDKLEFEFTSIVNHVFRTPLTRIMWLAKELENDLSREERLSYTQNLSNAANRIIGIVDLIAGIKDIHDKSGYLFEAVSMRDIVEKSMVKHREEIKQKNITFQVSTFTDVPLLTLDIKKISFVVDVLIENAIFYTPKDGKVLIDCAPQKHKIIFYVGDTGIGLSFMEKRRIFSKFYRGENARVMNTDGMGLGLYLARVIIERHKGSIYAKSKGRNQGSTFLVELPFGKY